MRSIELPLQEGVKLVFDPEYNLSEADYLAFCGANPDVRCERTVKRGLRELAADGPVKGFVMKLDTIWRGLR